MLENLFIDFYLFKTLQIVHSLNWNKLNIELSLHWNTHINIVAHAQIQFNLVSNDPKKVVDQSTDSP